MYIGVIENIKKDLMFKHLIIFIYYRYIFNKNVSIINSVEPDFSYF